MRKILVLLIISTNALFAQTTYFNIQFDYDSIWNAFTSIAETNDFYIAVGGGASFTTFENGHVVQISKQGMIQGFRKIDFLGGSKIFDITSNPTNPIEIDVSGRMNPNGFDDTVNSDLFLCRLEGALLDTLQTSIFGVPGYGDYSTSTMLRTSDNGVVLTGYRFSPAIPGGKLLLLKTDSLWNQAFMKTYQKVNNEANYGNGVVETPDKGFIVVGSRSYNIYDRQGTYLRVDSLGNQIWWKDIVPQGDEELIALGAIAGLEDGTYLVTGTKNYFNPGFPRYRVELILNINESGEVLWSKEYGSSIYEDTAWRGLERCPDGNFITGGTKRENPYVADQKAYGTIAKISPDGDVLWERKYSASTEGKFYDVFWRTIPTSDGGFICAGSTWGDSITKENSWIVKLDSLGCLEPGCDSISTGVVELPVGENSPIKIYPNPTGGQLTIEAQGSKLITALKVYDLQGHRLKDETYKPGRGSLSFDLGGEPPGAYFCSALVGGVWVTRQFVKH
ncbi:MAG: T9SS type A sorting domain-containing protein [Saprospiraceae bacterium]|nr:MAG: T9SS type A sorting domain-containing protein [Saprospiraceae bacterium]